MKKFFIFLILTGMVFAQSNLRSKPEEVITVRWDGTGESDVLWYAVFYCQGADTTLFPFNTGTDPDSLWMNEEIVNWSFARTVNDYYCHIPNDMVGITYLRIGVAGINAAGKVGVIRCLPKVIRIKRPNMINNISN